MARQFIFLFGPRACGKSTKARVLGGLLPGWAVVDIDYEFRLEYEPRIAKDPSLAGADFYYRGCRELLLATIGREARAIVALNGGCLCSKQASEVAVMNVRDCRENGRLVLLLPTPFDFLNRRILFKREQARGYYILREHTFASYNRKINLWRQAADLVAYGSNPERVARRIVAKTMGGGKF